MRTASVAGKILRKTGFAAGREYECASKLPESQQCKWQTAWRQGSREVDGPDYGRAGSAASAMRPVVIRVP
jgi:hypothetical protein